MIMTTLMGKILQYCNMVAPRYIPRIESVDSKNIKDQILYTYGVKLFNAMFHKSYRESESVEIRMYVDSIQILKYLGKR